MRDRIERIQKICISIILCESDLSISYEVGCTLLNIEPLVYRRLDLCVSFIQKASSDPRHADMFCRKTNPFNTRNEKPIYREFNCRNGHFYDSPLCFLTRLLNKNPVRTKKPVQWVESSNNTNVNSGQWSWDYPTCIVIFSIALGCIVPVSTTV